MRSQVRRRSGFDVKIAYVENGRRLLEDGTLMEAAFTVTQLTIA